MHSYLIRYCPVTELFNLYFLFLAHRGYGHGKTTFASAMASTTAHLLIPLLPSSALSPIFLSDRFVRERVRMLLYSTQRGNFST